MAPRQISEPEAWRRCVRAHRLYAEARDAALGTGEGSRERQATFKAHRAFKAAEAAWREAYAAASNGQVTA